MNNEKMKAYKVKVNIQKTVTVYEDEFKEEDPIGRPWNEESAIDFAIATVLDKSRNDPNYASAKIIEDIEYELERIKRIQ